MEGNKMKITGILICTLLMLNFFGNNLFIQNVNALNGPPEDFTWYSSSHYVNDFWHANIESGDHVGIVEGIEDSDGDGSIGYCDYIVINWRNSNQRQPYWKYHIKDRYHVDDPEDENYCRYAFVFDYKSKSRLAPKIQDCCHYVDDNNTQGPWDGSFENPYRLIQDALDSASIGDNIYVLPGIYYENIEIKKPGISIYGFTGYKWGSSSDVIIRPDTTYDGHWHFHILVPDTSVAGLNFWNGDFDEEGDAGILVQSDNNTIMGNNFYDFPNGIYLLDSASNNIITENNIYGNQFGVFIDQNCNNNLIYNNNLYENIYFNAKDNGMNNWYNDFLAFGNYYDDYNGVDADHDGIGDTPHSILGGGNNIDNYPLMSKYQNKNPEIESFTGSSSGVTGTQYNYTVVFNDEDYHDGYFEIFWDDGTPVDFSEVVGADHAVIFNHVWSEQGIYNVKVKAVDIFGGESDWATLEVSMPKNKPYFNTPFLQFLENHPSMFPLLRQLLGLH
jgi:parallel beta-helix repeat protein